MNRPPPTSTLFPYPPPSRSAGREEGVARRDRPHGARQLGGLRLLEQEAGRPGAERGEDVLVEVEGGDQDRKSTRLNSSHANISYAVFCLKKKHQMRTVSRPS